MASACECPECLSCGFIQYLGPASAAASLWANIVCLYVRECPVCIHEVTQGSVPDHPALRFGVHALLVSRDHYSQQCVGISVRYICILRAICMR